MAHTVYLETVFYLDSRKNQSIQLEIGATSIDNLIHALEKS